MSKMNRNLMQVLMVAFWADDTIASPMSKPSSLIETVILTILGFVYLGATGLMSWIAFQEFHSAVLLPKKAVRVDAHLDRTETIKIGHSYLVALSFEYQSNGEKRFSSFLYPPSRFVPEVVSSEDAAQALIASLRNPLSAYAYGDIAFLRPLPLAPLLFFLPLALVLLLLAPMVLLIIIRRFRSGGYLGMGNPRRLSDLRTPPYWAHLPSLFGATILSFGFVAATSWMIYVRIYLSFFSDPSLKTFEKLAVREGVVLTLAFGFSLVFLVTFSRLLVVRLRRLRRNRFDIIDVSETTRTQVDNITTRRRFKAVFGICLSLLLTGFTYLWVGDYWGSDIPWHSSLFFTLLALPLMAVTSYSVWRTWGAFKDLSAPTPKLFFPKKTVNLGSTLEVRWELDAGTGLDQITSLSLSLNGIEIATAGEGEGMDTMTSEFYSQPETFSGVGIQKGAVGFHLPLTLPPSFEGHFNHIRWAVGLHLTLRDGEVLTEDFAVTILPKEAPLA